MQLQENKTQVNLFFHEVSNINDSGFNYKANEKYRIDKSKFMKLLDIAKLLRDLNYEVHFSIDDGGISNEYIAEQLTINNFKACFFIPTRFINTPRFLDKNALKKISAMGHEIGSHSHNHTIPFQHLNYTEQFLEWKTSINFLRNTLDKEITSISFPGGGYKTKGISLLQDLGVKNIYTSYPDPFKKIEVENKTTIYGRYCIDKQTDLFQLYRRILNQSFLQLELHYKLKKLVIDNFAVLSNRILRSRNE